MEQATEYQAGQQEKLDAWAIVEIFGHSRIAGRVSEYVLGGSSFVRVDVPAVNGQAPFTRLYGPGAIYSMTFVDEETATRAAEAIRPAPITVYLLEPRQLPAYGDWSEDSDRDGDDDVAYQAVGDDLDPEEKQ